MREKGLLGILVKVIPLAIVMLLLIPLSVAWAKGPPSKVVITGPGLADPVEIESPEVLEPFSLFQFELTDQPAGPPSDPGPGYMVTRLMLESDGEYRAWDRIVYFPNLKGTGGVVFYMGLVDENMSTEFDGEWYLVSQAGDAAMRDILVREGVLEAGDPSSGEPIMILGGAGLLIGMLFLARFIQPREESGEEGGAE